MDDDLVRALAHEMARRGGAKGGHARAAKLSREERTRIARLAAKARWENERKAALRDRPRRRLSMSEFLGLPVENPQDGAPWRLRDEDGRWLIVEPMADCPIVGLKCLPIITVRADGREC